MFGVQGVPGGGTSLAWPKTGRVAGGTHGGRDNQGVVPFGQRQGDSVYLCDQHMILMEVERMVGECTIIHRPFFVIPGDHVGE